MTNVDSTDQDLDSLLHQSASKDIALCLSGGGYRAMLFHLGVLWRINEIGLLKKLNLISAVSGGAIIAGFLGLQWKNLHFDNGPASNFEEEIVNPIRHFASVTIDVPDVIEGWVLPGTIAEKVAQSYRRYLFGDATLQDLPDDPVMMLNATNLQSGAMWRFSKAYMADYRVGMATGPTLSLASAVAASSGLPALSISISSQA